MTKVFRGIAGRVLPERFIVEAWPSGSDCAFPGANDANFERHRRAGFDTLYMYWGGSGRCGFDGATMANVTAPATPELNILVGDDFLQRPSPETAITDPSAIVGFLTGDESDGEIDDEDGIPRPAKKADDARRLWSMYPGLPVYNGGKTNKNVGAFAGMTDVQGMDLYIAACAPHITRPSVSVTPSSPLSRSFSACVARIRGSAFSPADSSILRSPAAACGSIEKRNPSSLPMA